MKMSFFNNNTNNNNNNKKTLSKRQIDGVLRKRELLFHTHCVSIFHFQSNTFVTLRAESPSIFLDQSILTLL